MPQTNQRPSEQVSTCLGMDRHVWTHPTKSSSLRCYLYLVNISMQKIKDVEAFPSRVWWSKNLKWLDERILVYNLWSRILPDIWFAKGKKGKKDCEVFHFRFSLLHAKSSDNFFKKTQIFIFGTFFGQARIFLENPFASLCSVSRILSLCKTPEKNDIAQPGFTYSNLTIETL